MEANIVAKMRVIGLTGGAGCGKSFVASVLMERFPVEVIFTDEIARQQMEPDGCSYQAVVQKFGKEILQPDGRIDRGHLARIVFQKEDTKKILNQLTHPQVRQEVLRRLAQYRDSGCYLAVFVETALLLEAGYQEFCDEVWYIWASVKERKQRLLKSRGYTNERIEAMFRSQASEAEFFACADRIIENREGNSPDALAAQIKPLIQQWEMERKSYYES